MPTRNVHLTTHSDSFIASGIEAGRYSNASEAVRAGLRLLEQQEQQDQAKLDWLRGAFAALDCADIDSFVGDLIADARANRAALDA